MDLLSPKIRTLPTSRGSLRVAQCTYTSLSTQTNNDLVYLALNIFAPCLLFFPRDWLKFQGEAEKNSRGTRETERREINSLFAIDLATTQMTPSFQCHGAEGAKWMDSMCDLICPRLSSSLPFVQIVPDQKVFSIHWFYDWSVGRKL